MLEVDRERNIYELGEARESIGRVMRSLNNDLPEGRAKQVYIGALFAAKATIQSVEDALKMMEPE